MKTLTVLGSTGSIGTNTHDIVRRNRHHYQVYALVAGNNIALLAEQIVEFRPKVAVTATSDSLTRLTTRLSTMEISRQCWPELFCGDAARVAVAIASEADTVISAIVGVAGLEAT